FPSKRPIKNGVVPPACDRMNLILGNRVGTLFTTRLMAIRVVSVPYSIGFGGNPGIKLRQHAGSPGCEYTIAFRRFSSSSTGVNIGSPRYFNPQLVVMPNPSAFNVSSAYSISFKLLSISGN